MFEKILKQKNLFTLLFLFSLTIFLLHTTYTKTAIFADARFYFMITHSIVKDKDIKFTNEYEHFGMKPDYTRGDYVWNMYPPGVAFFWIFSYFLVDGLSSFTLDSPGYDLIHQTFIAMTNTFLAILGLYLIYFLLQNYFSKRIAILTTLALYSTTNLFFYIAVEPINSHPASFFISTLFVYYFLRHRDDIHFYFILGIIGGVAGLTRTQDLLILILPVIENARYNIKKPIKLIDNFLKLFFGFLIGFLPQIYFWQKIFGTTFQSPYIKEGFNFIKPHILHVLFNNQNGLFMLTPALAISVLGLFLIKNKKMLSSIKYYSLIYFLIQLYLISSWSGYNQGGSFSIRMMITTYPLLSFGQATIIEKLSKFFRQNIILLIIFLFSLVNALFIINYLLKH